MDARIMVSHGVVVPVQQFANKFGNVELVYTHESVYHTSTESIKYHIDYLRHLII